MSYKYETQYNSPNFTAAADAPKVWGRPRTIDAIAIHWWGDPNTNPSYNGVINTLINPARGASAHFVATGTGRKVACLVNLYDASWATNQANPYTISIECDPRCRDEDYDVVAEVIAQIWSAYGYKPLVPHRQFVATACPGNYDLARLEALAKTKDGSGDWGDVKNKVVTPPAPTKPTWTPMDNPRTMIAKTDLFVRDLANGVNVGEVIKAGTPIEFQTKTDWKGKPYLRSKSSTEGKRDWGIDVDQLTEIPVVEPPVVEPPVVVPPVEPPKPTPEPTDPDDPTDGETAQNWLTRMFKAIWETLKKFTYKK